MIFELNAKIMSLRIYNSLTKNKDEFVPIIPGEVNMYVCGPTVYDDTHIGHLRAAFSFDVIRRYLLYKGFKIKFVRNITDVDDKIIEKAKKTKTAQQDLNAACRDVADFYLKAYYRDMERMRILAPDVEPKATEHIEDMIKAISSLIDNGFAYAAGGDVYFAVRKFKDYGKLSNQSIEDLQEGARIHPGENKTDALDFALWKKAKPEEPSWESPWGRGRPGWHIECSVMSAKYLGESFDIHGGGRDLIFPHHENEIAQSEALSGKKFAAYWMHNGLLSVNSEKMSKSLGNYITLDKILERHHIEALKILYLGTHYSGPLDYTEAKLTEADRARERFYILFDRIDRVLGDSDVKEDGFEELAELRQRFEQAMDEDFNTAKALAILFDIVALVNKKMDKKQDDEGIKTFIFSAKKLILKLGGVLGLFFVAEETRPNELKESIIKALIEERKQARKNKDFKKADEIRQKLAAEGIIIEDTPSDTIWRKPR